MHKQCVPGLSSGWGACKRGYNYVNLVTLQTSACPTCATCLSGKNLLLSRELKCSHYPVKSAARPMSTREQQLAKQRMAVLRNDHILAFGGVRNLAHFLELFQQALCHSFHTCCRTWRNVSNHMPCLTVMHKCHLSVQRSLRCAQGIYICTLNMCT